MLKDQVNQWLKDGADYFKGLQLFEQHSKNTALLSLFETGPGVFTSRKLREELVKLSDSSKPAEKKYTAPVNESFKKFATHVKPDIDISSLPDELKQHNIRKGELYRKAAYLHSQLAIIPSDEERYKAAKTIIDSFNEINQIWAWLDYWHEHKKLHPDLVPAEARKVFGMSEMKRMQNLRSYISRDANNEKKADKVAKWKVELLELEALYNAK